MTAFALAVAFAVPVPTAYWPLAVGHRWRYQVDDVEDEKYHLVTAVTERKAIDGGVRFRLVSSVAGSNDGRPLASEWVSVRPDGVYRETDEDRPFDPPFRVLPTHFAAGQVWRQASVFRGDNWAFTHTAGRRSPVTVPAGEYPDAVRIDSAGEVNGKPGWRKSEWYARGVGPVRIRLTVLRANDLRLRAFTPAK